MYFIRRSQTFWFQLKKIMHYLLFVVYGIQTKPMMTLINRIVMDSEKVFVILFGVIYISYSISAYFHHFLPFLIVSHYSSPVLTVSRRFSASCYFSLSLAVSRRFSLLLPVSRRFSPFLTVSRRFSPFLAVSHCPF